MLAICICIHLTGAAQADCALLVVNATNGEFETGFDLGGQTREHTVLIRSLGKFIHLTIMPSPTTLIYTHCLSPSPHHCLLLTPPPLPTTIAPPLLPLSLPTIVTHRCPPLLPTTVAHNFCNYQVQLSFMCLLLFRSFSNRCCHKQDGYCPLESASFP